MAHYSNIYISKRAATKDIVKNEILALWHTNEGPFQNIFRLFSYATPFVPGLGWVAFILEKIASALGYGLAALGSYIDKKLNIGPKSFDKQKSFDDLGKLLTNMIDTKKSESMLDSDEIKKVAFLGALFKLVGGGKMVVPKILLILKSVVGWLLLAVGANNIDEIYKLAAEKANELTSDVIKKQFESQVEPENLLRLLTTQEQ